MKLLRVVSSATLFSGVARAATPTRTRGSPPPLDDANATAALERRLHSPAMKRQPTAPGAGALLRQRPPGVT